MRARRCMKLANWSAGTKVRHSVSWKGGMSGQHNFEKRLYHRISQIYHSYPHISRMISLILSHVCLSLSRAVNVIEECSPATEFDAFERAKIFRLKAVVTSLTIRAPSRKVGKTRLPPAGGQSPPRVSQIPLSAIECSRLAPNIGSLDHFLAIAH